MDVPGEPRAAAKVTTRADVERARTSRPTASDPNAIAGSARGQTAPVTRTGSATRERSIGDAVTGLVMLAVGGFNALWVTAYGVSLAATATSDASRNAAIVMAAGHAVLWILALISTIIGFRASKLIWWRPFVAGVVAAIVFFWTSALIAA